MITYIGTKVVKAKAMTRLEYNELRGWKVPDDENPSDAGYLVEYQDGGKPNVEGFAGYVSWSPEDVFERSYRPTQGLTFGMALEALKIGLKVRREGWNGKGMFIAYMPPLYLDPEKVNERTRKHIGEGLPLDCQPYIAMWTARGQWQPGWLASQADMLGEDWELVE